MGNTRYLFKTKGTFHAKMVSVKDRNCMDLTEAVDIQKTWHEYKEEQCKNDLNDPDNHDAPRARQPGVPSLQHARLPCSSPTYRAC